MYSAFVNDHLVGLGSSDKLFNCRISLQVPVQFVSLSRDGPLRCATLIKECHSRKTTVTYRRVLFVCRCVAAGIVHKTSIGKSANYNADYFNCILETISRADDFRRLMCPIRPFRSVAVIPFELKHKSSLIGRNRERDED